MADKIIQLSHKNYGETKTAYINIPEEIKFFYTPGCCGPFKYVGSEHYTTIVETDKYNEWIEHIKGAHSFVYVEQLDIYTIVAFKNICDGNDLPIVDVDTFTSANNIDFHKYVFAQYNANYELCSAYRINKFENFWTIDASYMTFKSLLTGSDFYSMSRKFVEWGLLSENRSASSHVITKIYKDDEADALWNSMKAIIIDSVNDSQASDIDVHYDFQKFQKEQIAKLKINEIDNISKLSRQS